MNVFSVTAQAGDARSRFPRVLTSDGVGARNRYLLRPYQLKPSLAFDEWEVSCTEFKTDRECRWASLSNIRHVRMRARVYAHDAIICRNTQKVFLRKIKYSLTVDCLARCQIAILYVYQLASTAPSQRCSGCRLVGEVGSARFGASTVIWLLAEEASFR